MPAVILEHIETFRLQVMVGLEPAGPPTLRAVELHVGELLRAEPHATWQDGSPSSADAAISARQGRSLAVVLERHAYYALAGRFFSERRLPPRSAPPANAVRRRPASGSAREVRITVVVNDDDWHHYFVRDLPLHGRGDEPDASALLSDLRRVLDDETSDLVFRLTSRYPVPTAGSTTESSGTRAVGR